MADTGFKPLLWTALATGAWVLAGGAALAAQTPDFTPSEYGWIGQGPDFLAPKTGPRPVQNDSANAYDFIHAADGRHNAGGEGDSFRIADLDNPILLPWTRESLRKVNQSILAGRPGYTPKVRCWPMGVPAFHLYNVTPIYFIQTPSKVWILAHEDHMVRRVYMNVPHSAHVAPSWYGESVGHYEGNALVVDTIGLTTKSFIDNFRTPHTNQLHVVERFQIAPDSKSMNVDITIEDPGAFTMPWHVIQEYRNGIGDRRGYSENVCAENTQLFGDADPVPQAKAFDF